MMLPLPHLPSSPRRRRAAGLRTVAYGFTLVELMVSLAILAVLLAAAATAMHDVGRSMKLSAMANGFVSGLRLARGEAIKRNARVVMCKSTDGAGCASAGGWDQGWILFHDRNNDGIRDAAETLIHRGEALPEGYRLTGNSSVARYLSFSPFGGTRFTSGAFQAGTITLCRQSVEGGEARQVVINAVGRLKVQRASVAFCG